MAQIPVEVWHIKKELLERLRAENTEESKKLLRQLDTREFFSNALSYSFSFFLVLTIVIIFTLFKSTYIYPEEYFYPVVTIAIAILSFWWSDKLKDSATTLLASYYKQKQVTNKPRKNNKKI